MAKCLFPILTSESRELVAGFQWRTRGGELLNPAEMETRHVFFTWLLIWNHSCPKHLVRSEGKQYDGFDSWYTPSRMLVAFGVMMEQLSRRADLRPEWRRVVEEVIQSYAVWRGTNSLNELRQICSEGMVKA